MRVGGVAVLQSSSVSSEILCVLDDAGCLVAPEVTDWVSFLEACHVASALCEQVATAIVVFLRRVNLSYLVLIVCDVVTDVVLEVFLCKISIESLAISNKNTTFATEKVGKAAKYPLK